MTIAQERDSIKKAIMDRLKWNLPISKTLWVEYNEVVEEINKSLTEGVKTNG